VSIHGTPRPNFNIERDIPAFQSSLRLGRGTGRAEGNGRLTGLKMLA
jgi:hypothetical protein